MARPAAAGDGGVIAEQQQQQQQQTADDEREQQRALWREARRSCLLGLFTLCCAAALLAFYFTAVLPPLKPHERGAVAHNFPPCSLPAVVALRDALRGYARLYPARVAGAILLLYVAMMSFAVPGTVSLSLLAGALYGAARGFCLICVVSTLGACSCYAVSRLFGRPIARAVWGRKLDDFSGEVSKRRGDLLSYVIFLRVTPVLPNFFINLASPVVGVPLREFALGTLLGCAPNNLVAVNAGGHLSELHSLSDLYSWRVVLLGLTVGGVALLSVWVKHRHDGRGAAAAAAKEE